MSSPDWTAEFGFKKCLFIVLELFAPFSLQQLISHRTKGDEKKANSVVREEEIQVIAFDIISALCHLHRHRIAHRDIKPDNILFRLLSTIKWEDAIMDITRPGLIQNIACSLN